MGFSSYIISNISFFLYQGISTKWLRNANEETIMNEIMINGPIVAGMESYPSLELHKQDVIYEINHFS
jgi:hypothetical protein